ncbi:hypothetical protein XM52_02540 [Roseovarius indicus]|uniref:Uncharacterized protein n=1 Tax=Roseovarius indicus TaxID=540747 RepID=A0A0T5PEV9_9RHOB|nr:hypothetical protein XM52_02540 [Roseovarius indicus]
MRHGSISIEGLKICIEGQKIEGSILSFRLRIGSLNAPDEICLLKLIQVAIDGRPADFAILSQSLLRRVAAARILVVAVRELPKQQFHSGFEPALFDGPLGCTETHRTTSGDILLCPLFGSFPALNGTTSPRVVPGTRNV